MTVLFFSPFLSLFSFKMSSESEQGEDDNIEVSSITEAKSLLSNGYAAEAFAVLVEAAEYGDVMACYDCGFMMIKGIGYQRDMWGEFVTTGLSLMQRGKEIEEQTSDADWKIDGSVTELLEPQSMCLTRLLFVGECVFELPHFILNLRINKLDSNLSFPHLCQPVLIVICPFREMYFIPNGVHF